VVLNGSPGATPPVGDYIHDLELCSKANGDVGNPDGIFAVWGNNSRYSNLSCSNAYYSQIDLFDNDYLSRVENFRGFGGHVGLAVGAAFNDGILFDNQIDGVDVACEVNQGGGGGDYEDFHTHCIDRGGLRYGWIQNQSQAHYTYPFVDQETSNNNWVATFLLNGPAGSNLFDSGNIDTRNGAPYIIQDNGGYGSTFMSFIFNTFGEDRPATEIIKYTNGTPVRPTLLIAANLPNDVPISNLPQFVKHGPGCNGSVTLTDGTGYFSDECIFPKDVCFGQDTTKAGTAFTLGVPSAGRSITDLVFDSTTKITSMTASFDSDTDTGRAVYGANVPPGDFVASVSSRTTAVLNAATTATGSRKKLVMGARVAITNGAGRHIISVDCE
jgi:hypothetical protein